MSLVAEYLGSRGVRFQMVFHEATPTSAEEADALGVSAADVLKTLVIETKGKHVLAVIPASRRLNVRRLREALGDPHARLATESEILHDFRGYELGAMHPLGSLVGCRTFVDPEVFGHESVLFAAGYRWQSIRANPAELFRDEQLTVVHLTDTRGLDRLEPMAMAGWAWGS